MSKQKQDEKALQEAREAEFKAKLLGMSLEAVLEMHPELESEIASQIEAQVAERSAELEKEIKSLKASGKVEVKSGVIMDKKNLDPKKKYVTGPNGLGFVEA